jgi:DNA-binding NtrC family response regulator
MSMGATAGPGRILFIDDDADVLTSVRLLLGRHEMEAMTARSPAEGLQLLAAAPVDAILLDLNFTRGATTGDEGLRCLADILEQDREAVVVVVTGHSGINIAVAAMRAGASDFVTKPWSNERLVTTIRTAVELRRRRRQAGGYRSENAALLRDAFGPDGAILGASPAMTRLRMLIDRAAPTEANVLILGENGTGKELVARALHQGSTRAAGPFIPVDLAALPEAQLEAELFGQKRGAAPGGETDRAGRFVAAHGGTLFLDEVSRLPLALQAKLLSALERRQITPVGADRPVPVDVRVVAASNRPRQQLYAESSVRADLLCRLNTVEISVPPLRDRGEDVIELSHHYLRLYARRYGRPDKPLAPAAVTALKADRWRGNVRALRHAMERAVVLSDGGAYEARDFALGGAAPAEAGETLALPGGDLNLARSERWLIEQALQRHHYNVSHAARELGLTRAALYRRMEKHGL